MTLTATRQIKTPAKQMVAAQSSFLLAHRKTCACRRRVSIPNYPVKIAPHSFSRGSAANPTPESRPGRKNFSAVPCGTFPFRTAQSPAMNGWAIVRSTSIRAATCPISWTSSRTCFLSPRRGQPAQNFGGPETRPANPAAPFSKNVARVSPSPWGRRPG